MDKNVKNRSSPQDHSDVHSSWFDIAFRENSSRVKPIDIEIRLYEFQFVLKIITTSD